MTSYVRSESVVSRVIAGETLIIPVRKGVGDLASIFSLNGTASMIWAALECPRTREQIVTDLSGEFSAGGEQLDSDVRRFLDEMCSLGLISSSAIGAAA